MQPEAFQNSSATPTALRYINQLLEKDIVREITGRARDRVFSATAIVEAVSES